MGLKKTPPISDETLGAILDHIDSGPYEEDQRSALIGALVEETGPDDMQDEYIRPAYNEGWQIPEDCQLTFTRKDGTRKTITISEMEGGDVDAIAEWAEKAILHVFRQHPEEVRQNHSFEDIVHKILAAAASKGATSKFKWIVDNIVLSLLSNNQEGIPIEADDLKKCRAPERLEAYRKLVEINTNFLHYISSVLPEDITMIITDLVGRYTNWKTIIGGVLKKTRQAVGNMNTGRTSPTKKETDTTELKSSASAQPSSKDSDSGTPSGSKNPSSSRSRKKKELAAAKS